MNDVTFWKVLATIFGIIAIVSIAVLSALLAFSINMNNQKTFKLCKGQDYDIDSLEPHSPPIFHDLTKAEIISVIEFLLSQTDLKLENPRADTNVATKNLIVSIDLLPPNKTDALRHLDSGEIGKRWARVVILTQNGTNSVYQEIKVGPLPKPREYNTLRFNEKERSVPYEYGPVLGLELYNLHLFLMYGIEPKVKALFIESFNATYTNCRDRCLTFTITVVPSWAYKDRKRLIWIRLTYKIPIWAVNPVDFYFLLDVSNRDPKNYLVRSVYYNEQVFSSLEELMGAYSSGKLSLLDRKFPTVDKNYFSTVHLRRSKFPGSYKRPPIQYEPDGKRYSIKNQQIDYMLWKFNYRMSISSGIQLFDIRYENKRIAYELSLQDLGVFYSGRAPVSWFADYLDSVLFLGYSTKFLVPGIDCPANAKYIPLRFSVWPKMNELRPNVMCVFEHDIGIPLRRHNAYKEYREYTGLVDYALILRTIITVGNYDYIIDFVFHVDGVLETRVTSTGYIFAEAYAKGGELYGFRLQDGLIGNLHHHVFNFKVDLDINGVKNRFETLGFEVLNVTNSHWTDKSSSIYYQAQVKRSLKRTELEAAYKYNFDAPKYLIFHNDAARTKYGSPKAYRIINHGISKQLLPENKGNEIAMTWARYQVAVTKFSEDEPESSSIYNNFSPIVNFQKMLDDDEAIVDEDLVAWVSMGLHHMPHAEDLPHTTTTGAKVSMLLQPYNFFEEDPSIGSKDGIRIEGDNKHVVDHRESSNKQCLPELRDIKDSASFVSD